MKPIIALSLTAAILGSGCGPSKVPATNDRGAADSGAVQLVEPQSQSPEIMEAPGSYLNYSSERVAAEQARGQRVVLFFHAPWCPYCKAADAAFLARIRELPAGVTVLKTDYDTNPVLKEKYGVTYQHTFVQIDGSQDSVAKWVSGDIDNLNKNLK